jgi:hypothetical protein
MDRNYIPFSGVGDTPHSPSACPMEGEARHNRFCWNNLVDYGPSHAIA